MKKHIAEELPATKHTQKPSGEGNPQSAGSNKPDDTSGRTEEGDVAKQVRQAIYDIRYRARREGISLEQAYSQYIQNSNLPQEAKVRIRETLFPRGAGEGQSDSAKNAEKEEAKECYTSVGIDLATTSLSEALFKVFVEGVKEEIDEDELESFYEGKSQTSEGKKYPVRVTDPKSGVTYHRTATREKINELKAKGLEVEYDEYGEKSGKNYEGEDEKKKDEKEVKEALDPVGKEDKDIDNDGDHDKTDKYLLNRRKKIGAAIKKKGKKKVSEEYIGEIALDQVDPTVAKQPVDILPLGFKNKIKVAKTDGRQPNGMPVMESSLEKFMNMARTRLAGKCPECEKSPCECDTRDRKTEMNLLKNKVRAMGVKNPIIMDPPKGEDAMKVMTSSSAKMACEDTILEKRRSDKEDPESDPNPQKGGKAKDDKAYQHVAGMLRDMQGRPKGQRKKEKGKKDEKEGGKYSRMASRRKDLDKKAKASGETRQEYLDRMAQYGGEDNYKKGRGLGS